MHRAFGQEPPERFDRMQRAGAMHHNCIVPAGRSASLRPAPSTAGDHAAASQRGGTVCATDGDGLGAIATASAARTWASLKFRHTIEMPA